MIPWRWASSPAPDRDCSSVLTRTYGHMFEGSEAEAAQLVGAYLDAQQERAAAQVRTATSALADG